MTAVAAQSPPLPQVSPRLKEYRQTQAKLLRDLAWAFDRAQHEAYADPEEGSIGRMLAAVQSVKDVSEFEVGPIPRAHTMLAKAIQADIREGGFADGDAVELLYALYAFLNEGLGMKYHAGKWVAGPTTPKLEG